MSTTPPVCEMEKSAYKLNLLPPAPTGCSIQGPLSSDLWDKIFVQLQELQLCSRHLSNGDRDALGARLPASACSLDQGPKLFFKCF